MSALSDRIEALVATIEGVSGVENVRARPGLPLDLEESTATWLTAAGDELQRWTLWYAPTARHAGAADEHLELDVRVVAEFGFRESEDRYLEMGEAVAAVMSALMGSVHGIDENGIRPLETPGEPVRLETGEAAYRTQFEFHLLCV